MKIFIFVALLIVLIAASLSAQQIEYVGSTLWSGINDVKVVGDYAYCAFYNGLAILEVAGDSIISLVNELYLGGGSYGIDITGNFAYVADGTSGLQVINIADPYNPILVGNCIINGNCRGIQISNHTAYIADALNGLIAIDISEPTEPEVLGTLNFNYYSIQNMFLHDNRGYLIIGHRSSPHSMLKIVDVSNPSVLTEVGEYDPGYNSEFKDVVVEGNYAFLATSFEGLLILNVANPSHILSVGSYNTNGGGAIGLSENYIYIASSSGSGLKIIDISLPISPTLIGNYGNGRGITDIFVTNNYVYLITGLSSNLEKISILNPASPSRCAIYNSSSRTINLFVSDSLAYIASLSGLNIIDISNPSIPSELAKENIGIAIGGDVFVSGEFAYLTDYNNGFSVIDVVNPANPQWIGGGHTIGGSGGVFISGNYAYLAISSSMQIIDITNPRHPQLAGSYATPEVSNNVYVRGNYAYIANYNYGLKIVNIFNPANPQFVGGCPTAGNVIGIFIQGDYAYLTAKYSGLQIVNISNPNDPVLVGDFDTPGQACDVFAMGEYVYIADYYSVEIINISVPNNPSFVANFYTPGYAHGIFTQGNYIYVADEFSFIILRFSTNEIESNSCLPASFSLSPNYPNPFNSSTTIRYNLPTESPVTIDIYDILGRKVQTLLDVKEQAGSHQVNWNAADMPSGAYFARLRAGEQSQTMKMILMK
jgi:hypothetical protein